MELLQFLPPVIAHRGASAYAPENTLVSFTKAAQLGARWVEFDVMLAACGQAIIFHDETLNRTTNGCGFVGDYSYDYLRTLDAGSWFDPTFSGERIPTLVQTLAFLKDTQLCANVEIKPLVGEDHKTVIRAVADVLQYFPQPSPQILFSSFSITALEMLRDYLPNSHLGLLMHEWRSDWELIASDLRCLSVHVNEAILTMDKAKKIKNSGKMLLSYTVNDAARAKDLFAWGVDAVFSDAPDKIADIIV